jgi:superfamily II DNA/RNA helicase
MTNVTSTGTEAGSAEFQTEVSSSPNQEDGVRFEDLGLAPEVLRAVAESGYTKPTPIQAQGIPHVLKRRDVIGIAQTGTGKTASFTLPMIEMLARGRAKARMPRSLILEPTRELAAQVSESFERYGKYNKLSMALLIGGVSFEDQDRKLDRGVDVLIATPGRLLDHFERGKLMLSQVQLLVIDEADRMLDMGFIPDVERICKLVPFTRQTLFYSATMPPEIQRLTDQFLHDPVRVEVSRPATTAENIAQEIVEVPNNDWAKREGLRRLIRDSDIVNAIVFCNRKRDVDVVAKSLIKHGFSAAALHGDLDQSVRTRTLDAFRAGDIKLLVASDVAARGLDIPAVGHIFNFDVPFHADDYVHRIGRTGRAGRSGLACTLATAVENKYVEAIERLIGTAIPRRKLEGIEVREHAVRHPDRRNHSKQDSGRQRPIKPHGQVAKMEPLSQASTTPSREAAAESEPGRTDTSKQRTRRHVPHDTQSEPHDNATPDGSRLPAFVFRPVPLPKVGKVAPIRKKLTAEG